MSAIMPSAGMGSQGVLANSSSSSEVTYRPVMLLADVEIQLIMHCLGALELSCLERTCRRFLYAANSGENHNPWKKLAELAYREFSENCKNTPHPFDFIFRNGFRMTDQSRAEWELRSRGIDIEVPPHADISKMPLCPFIGTKRLFFISTNDQEASFDTIEKIWNSTKTGSNYPYFLEGLFPDESARIRRQPVALSPGWYQACMVEESRNKSYDGPHGQEGFVRARGYPRWKLTTGPQAMCMEVKSIFLGKSLFGKLHVRTSDRLQVRISDKTEETYLTILPGGVTRSVVCHSLNGVDYLTTLPGGVTPSVVCQSSLFSTNNVVLALREVPILKA